jgi:hypothetical protein
VKYTHYDYSIDKQTRRYPKMYKVDGDDDDDDDKVVMGEGDSRTFFLSPSSSQVERGLHVLWQAFPWGVYGVGYVCRN